MLARLLAVMGEFDEAIRKATQSFNLAKDLAHPNSLAYATFWIGWIRHLRGEYEEALQYLEAAMDLARQHGLPQVIEWGRVVRGSSLTHLGRMTEGIAAMRTSLDNQAAMHCLVERPYCMTLLADALVRNGSPDEALKICDQALAIAQRTEGRSFEAESHRVRGEAIWALSGIQKLDSAASEMREALQIALATDCRSLALRAALANFQLLQYSGQPNGGRLPLQQVVQQFARESDSPWLANARRLNL
jgi:tetratricopeptide (TPR) repeat protein